MFLLCSLAFPFLLWPPRFNVPSTVRRDSEKEENLVGACCCSSIISSGPETDWEGARKNERRRKRTKLIKNEREKKKKNYKVSSLAAPSSLSLFWQANNNNILHTERRCLQGKIDVTQLLGFFSCVSVKTHRTWLTSFVLRTLSIVKEKRIPFFAKKR